MLILTRQGQPGDRKNPGREFPLAIPESTADALAVEAAFVVAQAVGPHRAAIGASLAGATNSAWKCGMRLSILALLVAAWTGAIAPAHANDFSADLATVRRFLVLDQSYSPSERAMAEAAFAELAVAAPDMTPAAFHLAVARIAALSGNGHTMLPAGLWTFSFNRIPLRLHVFADGLHVVHAPEGYRELLGARIVSIDGRTADELRVAFGRYFGARAGKRDEWAGFLLESPELMHAAGLAQAGDRLELVLQMQDGSQVRRTIPGALDAPAEEPFNFIDFSRLVLYAAENSGAEAVPFYLQGVRRNFVVTALPELEAVYLQIRLNKDFYEQKAGQFFAEARASINSIRPKHAIVDLRLDHGGDLNTTREFLQALPAMTASDGRIFLLTSGRTFSAGIASAGYLKQAAPERVTIVGEPIGDFLEFWAEGEALLLEQSGAALLFASERHNYLTGCQESDCHSSIRQHPIRVQSLEPDVAATLTYADYRAGRDVALEAVRRALCGRQ